MFVLNERIYTIKHKCTYLSMKTNHYPCNAKRPDFTVSFGEVTKRKQNKILTAMVVNLQMNNQRCNNQDVEAKIVMSLQKQGKYKKTGHYNQTITKLSR